MGCHDLRPRADGPWHMPSACTKNQTMPGPKRRTGTVGSTRTRGCKTSPRQPPCWQRGNLPSVGTMPVDGRSPGSQVLVLKRTVGFSSPSQGFAGDTKERTIRRERGVLPRLIVLPPQWLFRPALSGEPVAPCDPSLVQRQGGWRTLAAIQSRGRLRSACPVGVHAFAFPFALRTTSLPSGNHPT
jgi:hypothetical protein